MTVENEEFGQTVVVEKPTAPKKRKVEIVCEVCGGTDVSATFTCVWSIEYQLWIGDDHYGNDDYCSNCDSETCTEERII